MSDTPPDAMLDVLAVDDDAAQRHVLNATLFGVARVEFCPTPDQAIAAVRHRRFDAAILDVHLKRSRLDGFDIARALQEIDPELEILLYTGDDSAEVLENALEVRARRRILKASSRAAIVQAVRACAEATRRNRVDRRDAVIGKEAQRHFEEQNHTVEISRTVADLYRGFFHSLANELTALGVTGAVLSALGERAASANTDAAARRRLREDLQRVAGANAETLARISTLVRQMTTEAGDLTNECQRAQISVVLQALATIFLGDPRLGGKLRVVPPPTELVLPISPAALVNALSNVIRFLLAHAATPTAVTLAATVVPRTEATRLIAHDRPLLVINRNAPEAPRYVRIHCQCDAAQLAHALLAPALAGPPAAGALYALAHLSARLSAPVVCRQRNGHALLDVLIPAWA